MTDLFIDVNMTPGGVAPRIHLSQYDKGRNVVCTLFDGNGTYTIPDGATATIEGTKADNTGFQYDAVIEGDTVTFAITDQMTIFEGEVECEIVIRQNNYRHGSTNCIMVVEQAGLKSDVEISKTDLPLLEQVFEARDEAVSAAVESKETLEEIKGIEGGAVESIIMAKNEGLNAIENKSEQSLQTISNETTQSINEIKNSKDNAINEIDNEGGQFVELSKSWAIGDTNKRPGEDTDNSKFYSEQSKNYMEQTKAFIGENIPKFVYNTEDGCLYLVGQAKWSFFVEDGYLYMKGASNG